VNHDVEVSTKDNGEHSSWSCGKKEEKRKKIGYVKYQYQKGRLLVGAVGNRVLFISARFHFVTRKSPCD
jgi:hypothetical protein